MALFFLHKAHSLERLLFKFRYEDLRGMSKTAKTKHLQKAGTRGKQKAIAISQSSYGRLLSEIKERVRAAQYEALRAVNKELVGLYWDIGRMIVERQTGNTWGKAIVQQLAEDLQGAFPGVGGFSAPNLWRMKAFFEAYAGSQKLAPLVREIGWSHNIIIFERCQDTLQREFYIRMTRKFGWSKNVLIHQIESQSYETGVRIVYFRDRDIFTPA